MEHCHLVLHLAELSRKFDKFRECDVGQNLSHRIQHCREVNGVGVHKRKHVADEHKDLFQRQGKPSDGNHRAFGYHNVHPEFVGKFVQRNAVRFHRFCTEFVQPAYEFVVFVYVIDVVAVFVEQRIAVFVHALVGDDNHNLIAEFLGGGIVPHLVVAVR